VGAIGIREKPPWSQKLVLDGESILRGVKRTIRVIGKANNPAAHHHEKPARQPHSLSSLTERCLPLALGDPQGFLEAKKLVGEMASKLKIKSLPARKELFPAESLK